MVVGQGRREKGVSGSGGDGTSGRLTGVVLREQTCAAPFETVLLGIGPYACLAPVVRTS